jgi:8-oxo-dGTP diphosphatase
MTTRITTGVFLCCGDKVLMMKRGLHKELGSGMWAGVGGHLDLQDIKNPRAIDFAETLYREVFEETGIEKSRIHSLKLRYIVVRKSGGEIGIVYHYFGKTDEEIPLPECDEGELHWKHKHEIPELAEYVMSGSVREALMHWFQNPESDKVYLVAVNTADNSAVISEI